MTTILLDAPVRWAIFEDDIIEEFVGLDGEPTLDMRDPSKPKIRVMDGVTPGGHLVGDNPTGQTLQPKITSPLEGTTGIILSPIIMSYAFMGITAEGNVDAHASSQWQVSSDPTFITGTHTTGVDGINLTSLDLEAEGVVLDPLTTYYARVRYAGNGGSKSDWSESVSFTTEPEDISE